MKVILKSKIKNLGNIGDIVEVRDGYGKNMLIPNGLALFYTDKNYEVFKVKKVEIEKQNQENKAIAEELKNKVSAREIVLIENAGDDGKLYGSISGVKLANFINNLLKINTIKKANIAIKEPIKNIGKFVITIELHPEVSFEKEVIIARSKEEAVKIKKGEFELKKNDKKELDDNSQVEVENTKETKAKKAPKAKETKEEDLADC